MHEGVWFTKNNFWQNDSCENLDNFSLIWLLYMHRWCLHGPINSYHSFWWSNLILCLYNVDTLNICMKECYNFCLHRLYWNLLFKTKVCWFELYLTSFLWLLLCGGYLISIAYWLFSLKTMKLYTSKWLNVYLMFCLIHVQTVLSHRIHDIQLF